MDKKEQMKIRELKKQFIVEDELDFWKQKRSNCEKKIKEWVKYGIKVAVINRQVIQVFNSNDLTTKEITEIVKITEMWLNIIFQIKCLKDDLKEGK